MARFGALLFLLLCLNISISQAQQCEEFKDGFNNYFQCILRCYKMHFGPRFTGGDLCTSDVTIEETTSSEGVYTDDDIDLSLDCIVNQCISVVPPSVCEDSSTPADSTVGTLVPSTESDTTTSISSTNLMASSDSTDSATSSDATSSAASSDATSSDASSGSTNSAASSDSTGSTSYTASPENSLLITESQLDYVEDCEDNVDAEDVAGSNASPVSTTAASTDSTDYSYEYYYDDDYAEASANASSSSGNEKAIATANATSANNGESSDSAVAQTQNNGNAQPQNNISDQPQNNGNVPPQNNLNTQLQNNNKTDVDTNMQNPNNENGYNDNENNPRSSDVSGTGINERQINPQVPASNEQYQNFGNQNSNQSSDVQPIYNQPQANNRNVPLQSQTDEDTSGSRAYASSSANGKASEAAASANGEAINASAPAQPQTSANAPPQNGNFQIQNNVKKSVDTNMQNSNNGNEFNYSDNIPQSLAAFRNDNNAGQINQQVSASNLQYQNFNSQRNNQYQYYYRNQAFQPSYNYPQMINQNSVLRQPAGGNNLGNQQRVYSSNGNQAPFSNSALGYANNNRVASATAMGNGNSLYGSYPDFRQNSGVLNNYGSRSMAFANSGSAANGGGAQASADAFSSMANARSSSGNFNPSFVGAW